MRWKTKEPDDFKPWEPHLVKGFLFFPKTINGETRWLETAMWKRRLEFEHVGGQRPYLNVIDMEWCDGDEP